jgi:hypothetical protein
MAESPCACPARGEIPEGPSSENKIGEIICPTAPAERPERCIFVGEAGWHVRHYSMTLWRVSPRSGVSRCSESHLPRVWGSEQQTFRCRSEDLRCREKTDGEGEGKAGRDRSRSRRFASSLEIPVCLAQSLALKALVVRCVLLMMTAAIEM